MLILEQSLDCFYIYNDLWTFVKEKNSVSILTSSKRLLRKYAKMKSCFSFIVVDHREREMERDKERKRQNEEKGARGKEREREREREREKRRERERDFEKTFP